MDLLTPRRSPPPRHDGMTAAGPSLQATPGSARHLQRHQLQAGLVDKRLELVRVDAAIDGVQVVQQPGVAHKAAA